MAERTSSVIKSKWLASIVSLLVGIGLGTTFGNQVLDSAGVPASCVRTIQRADSALATGQAVAQNGTDALDAAKALRFGEVADLLGEAKQEAALLVDQVKRFNSSRKECKADRED